MLKQPTNCILWAHPELAREPQASRFELIDTYEDESHWWRRLLKCRECGQLYFCEFYEEIDWVDGNDPQYSTFIPVQSDLEIELLKGTSRMELLNFFPRLQEDFPQDADKPNVRWMT